MLAVVALFVCAEDLFAFELTNIDSKAKSTNLLVESFTIPDRGLSLFGRDVVLVVEFCVVYLLHVLENNVHGLLIDVKLASGLRLKLLRPGKQIRCIHNQDTFAFTWYTTITCWCLVVVHYLGIILILSWGK